jgi:DNA-binding response OmpR family regulator/anti-sigma regulatory factor (Ser/Thr protein kinase)
VNSQPKIDAYERRGSIVHCDDADGEWRGEVTMTQHALEQVAPQPAILLVVEDDQDIQSALHDLFAAEGYTVLLTASGQAAIDLLEHERVDLMVLDVMLPDMNGYEVCEHVRHSDNAATPIVMLTALTQQRNVTQGLQVGADDYIKKPFAPDELLLRVRRLLQRQDELRSAEHEATRLSEMLGLVQRQLDISQNETTIETTLRREFLHNVATHMQALSGIVEAATRKVSCSADREIVQQLKSRVRSAALVYEITEALQEDPVEVGHLIRTIASALKSVYRPWRRVVLTVGGDPLTLPLAVASPLAMIVNELVTNCFKHAFPDNRFGKIEISYTMQDNHFTLEIADDGVGFEAAQAGLGRGRATVAQLAHSLGGSVNWQSAANGTRSRLSIPLQ